MKLAAQAKAGFYPANDAAVELIAKHLKCRPPDPDKKFDTINILDPCAGEGLAINRLADSLSVPEEHVYTVELDVARSEACKALMPKHNHLGPASFHGTQITGRSFGMAYVNPPFDNELGGGRREEQGFAEEATPKLVHKGVLVLVCPLRALLGNRSFVEFIDANYENVCVYKFPDGEDENGDTIRKYNEIVVIGSRRSATLPMTTIYQHGCLTKMQFQWNGYLRIEELPPIGGFQPKLWNNGRPSYDREDELRTWEIPHSWKPHTFKKVNFTDDELHEAIEGSPLGKILAEVEPMKPAAPPLPLDKGHIGLILASGMLDGVVYSPHGPHVVRGSSKKVEYHNKEASSSEVDPSNGAVKTKDVFSQMPVTVIRAVEQDGKIFTFSNEPEKDSDMEGL